MFCWIKEINCYSGGWAEGSSSHNTKWAVYFFFFSPILPIFFCSFTCAIACGISELYLPVGYFHFFFPFIHVHLVLSSRLVFLNFRLTVVDHCSMYYLYILFNPIVYRKIHQASGIVSAWYIYCVLLDCDWEWERNGRIGGLLRACLSLTKESLTLENEVFVSKSPV